MIKAFAERKRVLGKRSYNQYVVEHTKNLAQKSLLSTATLKFLNQEFIESMNKVDREKYTETLIVFNEQKRRSGKANYLLTIKALLIHGGVGIFLVDQANQKVLLQRRHPHLAQGNKWDPSASGHLADNKNSTLQEGLRELEEELGITSDKINLHYIRKFSPYRNDLPDAYAWGPKKTIFHIFRAFALAPSSLKFKLNPREVTEVKWFSIPEIKVLPETEISHALRGALLNINFEDFLK